MPKPVGDEHRRKDPVGPCAYVSGQHRTDRTDRIDHYFYCMEDGHDLRPLRGQTWYRVSKEYSQFPCPSALLVLDAATIAGPASVDSDYDVQPRTHQCHGLQASLTPSFAWQLLM